MKIFFKYSHNDDLPFRCIDLSRVVALRTLEILILIVFTCQLYTPIGREMTGPKLMDLKSLLQFLPPVYNAYYNNLIWNGNAVKGVLVDQQQTDETIED